MRTITILLPALMLAGCGQIDKPDGTIEGRVKFIAQTANALGESALRSKGISSITAEGRVLVLKMDSGADIRGPVADTAMLKALREIACGNDGYRSVIDAGAAIRFELSAMNGTALPPTTVSYCPPAK